MGLDMYLNKETYVGNEYREPEQRVKVIQPANEDGVSFPIKGKIIEERITTITENVAYWRKDNAIHQWFVKNIQEGVDDCGKYYVPIGKLKNLVDLCEELLINRDLELAREKLPTQAGFFFGGIEYDEHYWDSLKETVKMLKPLIKEGGNFYYQSSW